MEEWRVIDEYSTQLFDGAELEHDNLLVVKNLKKYFPIKAGFFKSTVGYVKASRYHDGPGR